MKLVLAVVCSSFLSAGLLAQASGPRVIRAVGQATVSVKPDQAKVDVGVVTQAATAQDAASQNATQVDAVLAQLRQVLGANADIQTISYSISPNYRQNQGAPPTLIGYTASNTVEVTISDLSLIGKVIDAASQAGANNVQGLRFAVKDPEPVRLQALTLASKQATAHAQAIAAGLGAQLGAVVSAQEGAVFTPLPLDSRVAPTGATTTPIETGLVVVQATVTVEIALQ